MDLSVALEMILYSLAYGLSLFGQIWPQNIFLISKYTTGLITKECNICVLLNENFF